MLGHLAWLDRPTSDQVARIELWKRRAEVPTIRTADEARAMFGAGSWQADDFKALLDEMSKTRPIELPTKWYRTAVEERRWIEDDDPGDTDPASPVHVVVISEWRRS